MILRALSLRILKQLKFKMKFTDTEFFKYYEDNIKDKLGNIEYYPKESDIFKAFNNDPKVIIIGQDPYHDGSATGLAFDSYYHKKIPPSLKNIMDEVMEDIGFMEIKENADSVLEHWNDQGVMLINTALTVEKSKAGSHTKLWAPFTTKVIEYFNTKDNIVWILWGNHAKSFKKYITNTTHSVIEGYHPSPLAGNKFKNGKYFSKCNDILKSKNLATIKW